MRESVLASILAGIPSRDLAGSVSWEWCVRDSNLARASIAHELAHAYLRNAGRGNVTDPEAAADALAASWGFSKPAM